MDKNKRNRTILGIAVVVLSLVVAVSLAGISFAAGGAPAASMTPAKYQYGKPKPKPKPKKIVICHHTGSKKHPLRTIVIKPSAWKAHARHHDTLGRCTAAQIAHAKKHHRK